MNALSRFVSASLVNGDNRRMLGAKIVCGKCSKSYAVVRPHIKGNVGASDTKEVEFLTKRFEREGWVVGRSAAHDRCPDCQKEAMETKPTPKLAVVPDAPAVAAPRQMTREDRRVVFEKLNEVYADEKTGYSGTWTDQKVSDDLGVPRAWVAQVREEMFGPTGGNEQIAAQIADAERVLKTGRDLMGGLQKEITEFGSALTRVENVLRDIRKGIGA